jgi:NDP-sugar pyrophosphorylase family protein
VRLRPLTLTTPKPLVPLANRPVIEHIVGWLEQYGVGEIILATQYRAAAFERWIGRRRHAQQALVRAVEEPEPRGTAGAVAHLADQLHGMTVVVNGDNLMRLDLAAMLQTHQAAAALATISTDAVADPTGRGVVVSDERGRVSAFLEKPAPGAALANTVNTGVYLLEPAALALIPRGRFCNFEQDVFPALIAAGERVAAFRSAHVWIDTGTPMGYLRAQQAVLAGQASAPDGALLGGVWQSDSVTIDGAAMLRPPVALGFGAMIAAGAQLHDSSIGRECHVLAGATVECSAVWDGCQIERGATIRDSILGYNCYVGAGAALDGAIIGDGCIIGPGAALSPGTTLPPHTSWPPAT